METKRHDRGRSNSDSSPVSPSSSSIITTHCESSIHKNKVIMRRSPSVTDYRSGRSSRNVSPHDKSRRKRRRRSSRSSERSRKHSRRPKSRSRSRGGRSRSREHRRSNSFNRSASRSLSRSRTYSYSRSRSRSKSRSCNRNRDSNNSRHRDNRRHHRHHHHRHYRATSYESDNIGDSMGGVNRHQNVQNILPIVPPQSNAFKNDGSFMEMFKKMQEQMQQPSDGEKPTTSALEEKPAAPPQLMVGKRRGGRILKTGMVAKPKAGQTVEQPKDAWSLYMAEVKKYREVCCQEEDNTRPLVK